MSNFSSSHKTSTIIVDHIQTQIAEGKLKAGDKLPSERKLAEKFNISRATIREAVSHMGVKGMVEIRQGTSTIIRDIFSPTLLDPLQELAKDNQKFAANVMSVRQLLEVEATKLAALNATKTDIENIENALNKMLNADKNNINSQIETDMNFHLAVATASQNNVLVKMLHSMAGLVEHEMHKTLDMLMQHHDGRTKLDLQHQQILSAIKLSDAQKAEQAALAHLQYVSPIIK